MQSNLAIPAFNLKTNNEDHIDIKSVDLSMGSLPVEGVQACNDKKAIELLILYIHTVFFQKQIILNLLIITSLLVMIQFLIFLSKMILSGLILEHLLTLDLQYFTILKLLLKFLIEKKLNLIEIY
jgi:hypothetical protein